MERCATSPHSGYFSSWRRAFYGLPPDTQDEVTAELEERGAGYPVVLVNSAIVCADGIDIDVVIEAAVEARDTQAAREPRLGCNCGRPRGTDC
jgi:hypothetical protein